MTDEQESEKRQEIMPVRIDSSGRLAPASLREAIEVAKYIAHSGMVPKNYIGNVGSVLIAIQMGSELGLSPMAAIQNIAVINGRPTLWGDSMLAVVMAHRDFEDIIESYDEKTQTATCIVKRRGRAPVTCTFSVEDAKTAGLWKKAGPWTQYPKRMLQMRPRGFALRDSFPDALRGIQLAEEARDVIDITEVKSWENKNTELKKEELISINEAPEKSQQLEPPHDPETGEVEEPKTNTNGQCDLGW